MKPDEIRELIELISRSNFASFEYEHGDVRLKLVKESTPRVVATPAPASVIPAPQGQPGPAAADVSAEAVAPAVDAGLLEMRSPIVGTFYASASPDSPPFVKVGSQVGTGDKLCIVEAMKVMNEIESEYDGQVVEVLCNNGQPVEYGEVLFRLRPA